MAVGVDISLLGDKALQRKLDALGGKAKTVFNRVARESAKRIRIEIAMNTPVKTGTLRAAMLNAKIRLLSVAAGIGILMPTREEVNIAPDDEYYYPFHVEYGHGSVPAHSYIRRTVDTVVGDELRIVARRLGEEITKEALKAK